VAAHRHVGRDGWRGNSGGESKGNQQAVHPRTLSGCHDSATSAVTTAGCGNFRSITPLAILCTSKLSEGAGP
jgi:hypothetical protein